jgi:hypothetical protein
MTWSPQRNSSVVSSKAVAYAIYRNDKDGNN